MFQADEVEAVLSNTKEILNQFLRKSCILCLNWLLSLICTNFLLDFSMVSSAVVVSKDY